MRFWSVRAKGKAPPILAELRPRRVGEGHAIARGAIEDVGTGDAELDQGWLLEGAPRETLRTIFDGPVCKKVLAVGTFALGIDDGTITASVNGSGSSDALTIKAAIDLVVAVTAHAGRDGRRLGGGGRRRRRGPLLRLRDRRAPSLKPSPTGRRAAITRPCCDTPVPHWL